MLAYLVAFILVDLAVLAVCPAFGGDCLYGLFTLIAYPVMLSGVLGVLLPRIGLRHRKRWGARLTIIAMGALLLVLASCGGPGEGDAPAPEAAAVAGRLVTLELWAGAATAGEGALPEVDVRSGDGQVTIRGPVETRHPVDGRPIRSYERIALLGDGSKRQLLAVTQGRAGLGRVLDQRPGLPERRFTGDVVFPLGVWAAGEVRQFEATEFTLFGPARRLITLEILDLDHIYEGVAHSLSYRLTIRDEAGRALECEVSVYSPGRGLVAFEASSYWQNGGCKT